MKLTTTSSDRELSMSDLTVTRNIVVTDPAGVHARTAVAIADIVRRSASKVIIVKSSHRVAATDVLQIMSLVAGQGDQVQVEAKGPDAAEVLLALEPLFAGVYGDEAKKYA
jgi:phosphotransferase system HPr (HPr) family protein